MLLKKDIWLPTQLAILVMISVPLDGSSIFPTSLHMCWDLQVNKQVL
jgi:hypothetical protein